MLLSGLTLNDLYIMIKEDRVKVKGLPRGLTKISLNQFSRKYGTSPDILQLARPNLAGNSKGYIADKEPLTYVGERVEADFMLTDFNMIIRKLSKYLGAITAYTSVDGLFDYKSNQDSSSQCIRACEDDTSAVHRRQPYHQNLCSRWGCYHSE